MAESTEELSRVKAEEPGTPRADVRVHPDPEPPQVSRTPTVVVDDLHIIYRVYGAATEAEKGNAANALMRLLKRQGRPQTKEVHAVRGVSFVAYHGDAIGIVGRNGSGKSTLLRAIAGLLPPHSGAVYTDGQPSLLGVNAALMRELTGERNIVLGCYAMGLNPQQVREKYDDIVDFSGIGEFVQFPMSTYSSGMGARLRFAIASAKAHDVLLIDEALATGDRDFKRKSQERIKKMREEAGTVFLVAHNLDVIEETCNRVIWLHKGKIKMDGDPKTVLAAYNKG
ncbi:ABC transporter ATP-binding protein [Planomonospora parontospora]|uniref:ABC transporter ATP-binding protein n=1 Tax=Planomonospora parontospora TaxID=58119 RepID=UPI00166F913D|nr:ABC transporter ATP-binding protein [Planomonospora parontospora]GGL45935.1 ABC transporter ATP-binding protein [Planomonospora parontospora subsp. antibiotica]GII18685.1 ABC transporter ATP-binding protein [Planomonospora parontospora subsp. antibiotica]